MCEPLFAHLCKHGQPGRRIARSSDHYLGILDPGERILIVNVCAHLLRLAILHLNFMAKCCFLMPQLSGDGLAGCSQTDIAVSKGNLKGSRVPGCLYHASPLFRWHTRDGGLQPTLAFMNGLFLVFECLTVEVLFPQPCLPSYLLVADRSVMRHRHFDMRFERRGKKVGIP